MSASTQDLLQPFDPTGYSSISGAQLLQYLTGTTPFTDKGIIIATTDTAGVPDVPDAAANTKWKNYFWLRIGASAVTPYIWNDSQAEHTDGTGNNIKKWYTIASSSIGVGTITNAMIADNTIESVKIVSLDAGKLTGSLPASMLSNLVAVGSAAGGSLTGTFPNPTLAANAVVTASITDGVVTNAKLETGSATVGIELTKLKYSGVAGSQIRTKAGPAEAEWFVPQTIVNVANPVASEELKLLRVKSDLTWEKVAPSGANGIGNVLQTLSKAVTSDSTLTAIPYDNTIPQITEGKELVNLSITPISSTSKLRITYHGMGTNPSAGNRVILALFVGATTDALCARAFNAVNSSGDVFEVEMEHYIDSPGAGVATTYRLRFGPDASTAYIGRDSSGVLFGGVAKSWFTIEEVVATLS